MNPRAAYTPAIKLSTGEILSGDSHSVLALKAIGMGFKDNLISGNLNYNHQFYPMNPTDEDLVPKIENEKGAIKFGSECSKGERDACERLIHKNELLHIVVQRWDNLRRLPMVAAAKRLENGVIYTDAVAHGAIKNLHPDITFSESISDTHFLSIAGFLHDDGRFFDRRQAAQICLSLTGIALNKEKMVSGEEWIPLIKDRDDAIDFGQRMHMKGFHHAKERIDIFTSLKKHLDHVKLLRMALKEFKEQNKK